MPSLGWLFKGNPGILCIVRWSKTDPIAVLQLQLLHTSPLPPQSIGRALVLENPVTPLLLEKCMQAAHGRVVDADLHVRIASNPISLAVQLQALRSSIPLMNR